MIQKIILSSFLMTCMTSKKSNNILFCEKRAEIHIELFQIIIKTSLNEKKHQSCKLSNLWHNKINTMSFSNLHSVKNTFDHIHTNNLFWPIIFVFVRVISPVYNTLINMIGYIKIGINEQRIIPFQTNPDHTMISLDHI